MRERVRSRAGRGRGKDPAEKHKLDAKSQFSYADVFDFGLKGTYIPILQALREELDREDYIELLKKAGEDAGRAAGRRMAQAGPSNDFASFKAVLLEPDPFWKHTLTWTVEENTDEAFEVKITECLWAKTFRDANAADIGYATVCHPDYAMAQGDNPKMRMERTKTLMQGHGFCNHRWLWEA
jgi:hypothetical protein